MPETIGVSRNRKIGKRMSQETQERLKSAHDRLLQGQEYRRTMREAQWERAYDQYMSDRRWEIDPNDLTADLVSVNISFSTVNTLMPFVADENPKFVIRPYSGDASTDNAAVLQAFLNRLWRSDDVEGQTHMRSAVFDYLMYGDGYIKCGYEVHDKLIFDVLGDPVDSKVKVARFFVERVNPWDFWIDPFSDGIYNARWVCQRIMLPARELENDSRYKYPPADNTEGHIDDSSLAPEDRERLRDLSAWVTVYEFYDMKERWMMAFLPGGTTPVRYIENIDPPFVQFPNYRIPNAPYHMGELEQIAALQAELNKTRSQMITHRRRNVMKWLVREDVLTPEAEEAIKSSVINDIIPIRGVDPFDSLIAPVDPQPLSSDTYAIDAQIRADINEITGVNEFLRGNPTGAVDTATEATILEGAANVRTRHKLNQIETAARHVGQLLLNIIRDVLPMTQFEEMKLYITGREAERLNRATGQENIDTDVVLTPTPETFKGKYVVEVERGSVELRNPRLRASNLRNMVQMMLSATPLLLQLGIPFDIRELMEIWLEAEGIEDVEALFEIDEQQAFMQQLAVLREMNAAQAGEGGQAKSTVVGGTRTPSGEPREATTRPPSERISEDNSGILPPRA